MRVEVLFFGVLRERFGLREQLAEFPGHTVADLLRYYRAVSPELTSLWSTVAVAVNQSYASSAQTLQDDDEVALLPPVSGGTMQVELTDEIIDTSAILSTIKAGEDGAVTVFDGIVRNNSRGRRTLYLDYTAYESMALAGMRALAQQAVERFAIRDVALVHRLGKLHVGETSVLIAISAAHRGPTFEACRWLIDTLKQTVPIYKHEVFEDGAEWGHGEPFPPELVAGA